MYKLLIVDDDPYCQDVLSDALDSQEYEMQTVGDGESALASALVITPDLILLDIELPEMDGIEVLKRLKANQETQDVPVIMVTAHNADSQIATCLDIGAIDHVVKPFSNIVVRARVRAALRSYDALRSSKRWGPERGKILSFIGSKGGVGTTTTALNVAMELAKNGLSTIACELRPDFGTTCAQLGASPVPNLCSLLDNETGKITKSELENCLSKHPTGLQTLLAPQECDELIEITQDQADAIVTTFADMSDYTLVDLPVTPFDFTDVVLRRSDFVILVAELETTSVTAAKRVLERLQRLGIGGNAVGAILTNRSSVASPITLSDVRSSLDCLIIGVVPPDPDACMYASKIGSPVVQSMPDSRAAGAYTCLANRLSHEQVGVLEF